MTQNQFISLIKAQGHKAVWMSAGNVVLNFATKAQANECKARIADQLRVLSVNCVQGTDGETNVVIFTPKFEG